MSLAQRVPGKLVSSSPLVPGIDLSSAAYQTRDGHNSRTPAITNSAALGVFHFDVAEKTSLLSGLPTDGRVQAQPYAFPRKHASQLTCMATSGSCPVLRFQVLRR